MASNPHDKLFKAIFSQPTHAGSALRSVLPERLVDRIEWTTLAQLSGSSVDPKLAEYHADLLFSARMRESGEAHVSFLFEHQSTPDARMALRLLRYSVGAWEDWSKEHGAGRRLPAVVPVVLYHGERRWSAARSFEALIGVPNGLEPTLRPYTPSFHYLIDDLSRISDEALRERTKLTAVAKLTLACLKHARSADDAIALIERQVDLLLDVLRAPADQWALEYVWGYIVEVTQEPEPGALRAFVYERIGPEAEATMATIAQQLIEQGQIQGERKLLLRQLRQRFGGQVGAEAERRIANATGAQLEEWADRVIAATTLADVLAD